MTHVLPVLKLAYCTGFKTGYPDFKPVTGLKSGRDIAILIFEPTIRANIIVFS